jgi:glutaredoxin 3
LFSISPPSLVKLKGEKVLPGKPMVPKVEIYTWSMCPFCIRAKALLDQKGVEFTEYCIDGDEDARDAMAVRADGRRSLPQIFINDQHIGGCDDLHALNRRGQLDDLLEMGST